MNFDDIFSAQQSTDETTITDFFGVDTDKMVSWVKDVVKLTRQEDVLDTDIVIAAMAVTETKEELAVLQHLVLKATMSEIMSTADESARLLEWTREALESMSEEAQAQYAEFMVGKLLENGDINFDDFDDE
tara:strand:+ start:202 stop:594 length:393 start_codon:yes stop_codon:yes gene_type:complete